MEKFNDLNYFKRCSNCGFQWKTRDEFLSDPKLEIIGYQTNFKNLTLGLFYFNHECRGTFTVQAGVFEDLYDGPIFKKRATGSEECPADCLYKDKLKPCPVQCECSCVREIVQIIKYFNKF